MVARVSKRGNPFDDVIRLPKKVSFDDDIRLGIENAQDRVKRPMEEQLENVGLSGIPRMMIVDEKKSGIPRMMIVDENKAKKGIFSILITDVV